MAVLPIGGARHRTVVEPLGHSAERAVIGAAVATSDATSDATSERKEQHRP